MIEKRCSAKRLRRVLRPSGFAHRARRSDARSVQRFARVASVMKEMIRVQQAQDGFEAADQCAPGATMGSAGSSLCNWTFAISTYQSQYSFQTNS